MSNSKGLTKREAANLCRDVAKFFEDNRDRWVQGVYKTVSKSACNTRFCAVGALVDIAGIGPKTKKQIAGFNWNIAEDHPATARAYKALGRVNGCDHYFESFNDECTSVDEVIKAFRKTATALDHGLDV